MLISVPTSLNATPLKQLTFSRYDQLTLQSDVLWKIERGVVRTLTWSEDGKPIILGFWGSGDIVGRPLTNLEPYQIECLTSVEVNLLPSNIWYQFMDAAIAHIRLSEELLNIVHSRPVPSRLLQLLDWLARKFGRDVEQGKLIELPLTHQALSEAICTTRVTVTRLLKQFEEEGILKRHGRYLVLCQPVQKLKRSNPNTLLN
ncbi:Crp/Fnr family transcriptional regulator [Phormidium sp. LEGE 05292]|uniref:Crp/Fnr family transcriptional regulator n=1 Tax=[Phormidium] sp. LEGE 05292 TaxID=767427 RepID=UPI00188036AE|nr:Crp/Fnr family transcriptional regulator [Phormidium sp. LEGE 05292]MBE9227678.1 Crp/Fnr family transcriptional regulator [Phormidium sp. LEGE 05292]